MVDNNLSNIYVSPFLVFDLVMRLNWQVYCRDSFQLPSFLPESKQPFCNTVQFRERKKAQQVCQLSRCYRKCPSLNRFHWVYWIIKFFFLLQSNLSFGYYFICYLQRFILTYEIIHTTEITIKHCRFEKHWIKYYGNRLGVFFIL